MLWDFLNQAYRLPMMIFKRAITNPMGLFVYGIISKWYMMVMIAAICVSYWVFKGLQDSGALNIMETTVRRGLMQAQSVAQNCTPKILNLSDMWECIQNTPDYVANADEQSLRSVLEKDLQNSVNGGMKPVHPASPAAASATTSSSYTGGAEAPTTANPYDNSEYNASAATGTTGN